MTTYEILAKESADALEAGYGDIEAASIADAMQHVLANLEGMQLGEAIEIIIDGEDCHLTAFRTEDGWEVHSYDSDGNDEVISL